LNTRYRGGEDPSEGLDDRVSDVERVGRLLPIVHLGARHLDPHPVVIHDELSFVVQLAAAVTSA
jgi:hypothetical protein